MPHVEHKTVKTHSVPLPDQESKKSESKTTKIETAVTQEVHALRAMAEAHIELSPSGRAKLNTIASRLEALFTQDL